MTQVMKGVRVLEVAQFTYVPAAGGVLSDWGADVIKIEHPVRGDAQRGIVMLQRLAVSQDRNMLMQHPNRVLTRRELETSMSSNSDGQVLGVHISNLRRKIGKGYIRTVHGIGYMLEK